ncbi:hypothetical protein C8J57DRAFT_1528942 [Mycena rebaudengoi]|nr:hypothetical protein C8J57DRAFT_1528942 [Mycena rebaudengoi]
MAASCKEQCREDTPPSAKERKYSTVGSRPANIVKDDSFEALRKIGRPSTVLPSPRQVGGDVHTAFQASKNIPANSASPPTPGQVPIIGPSSLGQCIQLSFLLDVSHTGKSLALAFTQCWRSTILAFIGDNTTSNDKVLGRINKAFDPSFRTRCFNHTLQFSAIALMKFKEPRRGTQRRIQRATCSTPTYI